MQEKVKSGIPGLDKMLGGGFPKGSVIAVSGGTGSGRTTFVFQFLAAGALEYDEPGLFLSFDEQKSSIYPHLASFGWDLVELEKKQQVVFIEYPQNELSSFVEQEGAIRDLIDTLGIKRVALDSITPFALLYTNPEERRTNTLKLVSALRSWKTVSLVSAEDIPGSSTTFPHTISGIESFADGFIHISFLREGRVRHRTVEVIKMRGCKHEHETRLALLTEKGFMIVSEEEKAKKRRI
ncbi:MAG: hypothetical protein N3G80_00350 [Candidatus Micrarchaeota archaeon]|nr:hypothetical protein [Candidatus Micrarchaeota archaeon]